ncbi:hypothetical protein QJS04_geneDACA022115 [Acorus gramineus]|uniref:Uncharacterized protein n=1 Tax=Acorus gramineus TaxID=55184 RepID=A0AAV9AYD6_ACOGR|nr:hypothetical protein QJS04_geneDACA022115 [Acorus gramineus]
MFKQSSIRNQRPRGFKEKHVMKVLEICFLVAICVWVVYFVKHFQLKKTAFNEKNKSTYDKIEERMIDSSNLGRKDLSREIPVTITETGNQNKEGEPDEVAEGETKLEEIVDDKGRGTRDDEVDEHDLENEIEESEKGEEGLEDSEEKESEENENDGKEENDDQEASGESAQIAREEQYHGDNASSAVLRDAHTENKYEREKFQNQNEEQKVNGMKNNGTENTKSATGDVVEKNNKTRQENIVLLNPVMAVEGRETVEINSNMTPSEAEDDIQLPNNIMKGELEVHLEPLNNSMTVESTDRAESQRNPTATEPQSKTRTMAENESPGVYNSSNLESSSSSAQNETSTQDENPSIHVETRGEDHYESYDSLFS